jgi:L-Ala-D/L-Glu epimerase
MSRIKSIAVWNADLGNIKPYTIAFKTIDEVRNAFVSITLENGMTGLGAGNPSQYVTGESLDQTLAALDEKNLAFMLGADIREFRKLNSTYSEQFPKCPAARAAVDIALHDAFTQYLGVPLVSFLGRKINSLPTSNTIGIKSVADTVAEAKEYGERGFTVLKVKLGKELEEDIERIVKLREVFGDKFIIRIDANQGYTFDETVEFYNRTKSLSVELIEQPLPAKSVDEMKRLPAEIRKIIAADESLLTSADALELVNKIPGSGIFNIKLMKCGGIAEALNIATIAKPAGVELFWGCNDESIISITAALHAAFACQHTRYIDLDGSLDLAHDIVKGGFVLKDGVMTCSEKPGLGLERIN